MHIGAEKAQNLTAEYEEECRQHNERIAEIERSINIKAGEAMKRTILPLIDTDGH